MRPFRLVAALFCLMAATMATGAAVGDPYMPGSLKTKEINITKGENGSPREAIAVFPQDTSKSYPLVVFQHGFMTRVFMYTDLMAHIASHGYVVVAPQMYGFKFTSFDQEVTDAIEFLEWLGTSLEDKFKVKTDTMRTIISGHSRGGRAAFDLMNNHARGKNYALVGVAGVDPVDAGPPGNRNATLTSKGFTFKNPALIIGAELGTESAVSCNPKGFNSVQFYDATVGPTLWARIPDAGHGDMMNLGSARLSSALCKSGGKYKETRETVGGLIVSFANQVLAQEPLAPPKAEPPMKVIFKEKNISE